MEALDKVPGDEIVSIGNVIGSWAPVPTGPATGECLRTSRKTGADSLEGEMNVSRGGSTDLDVGIATSGETISLARLVGL